MSDRHAVDDAGKRGLAARLADRLRRGRWLIAAMGGVLLVLLLAQAVTALAAGIAFLALLVGVAALPDSTSPAGIEIAGNRDTAPVSAEMQRFAQSLPDPCFLLDRGGVILFANDRAGARFSLGRGAILTSRLRYPELIAAFDRVARGEGAQQIQFTERVPTERWFSGWLAPLDRNAPPGTILLILGDVTEARRADRMRADFVANASHELRTPLASLAGFIETLIGPARDDPVARDRFLGIMHEQATRMSRLIDDLLSLSRIEMKAHARPLDPVDLGAVLRHVMEVRDPLTLEMGITVEADLPTGPVVVPGDRDELVEVFDNLIENACKYGGSGGRIVIRLDGPAAGSTGPAAVSVTDFGPGIAAEHLPRLTERFYRVDADASRRHRGTGLGLAIVKHIVTRHRARLQIESAPGKGARFIVHFPEARSTAVTAEKAQQSQTVVPSRKRSHPVT